MAGIIKDGQVYAGVVTDDHIKEVIKNGGVFAYNVAPWQEGRISEPTMEQLRFLAKNLK